MLKNLSVYANFKLEYSSALLMGTNGLTSAKETFYLNIINFPMKYERVSFAFVCFASVAMDGARTAAYLSTHSLSALYLFMVDGIVQ